VPVSALKGENIEQLLEMSLLVSELEIYKASKDRNAIATVVEAHLDPSLGPVATVIVNAGTLKVMDSFVVGDTYGRVKMIQTDSGKKVRKLPPSGAALIAGMDSVPLAGDIVQVLKDEKSVKQKVSEIADLKLQSRAAGGGLLMDELVRRIAAGKMKTLKIILKADAKGSLEAITQALAKIQHDEVAPKIIHAGVGDITESDVMMASASQGLVIGFHVDMPLQVAAIAEKEHVECRKYQVIYDITDDIKRLLSGLLEPERIETILGHMQVREIFMTKRKIMIIGGKVTSGSIKLKQKFRLLRGEENIGKGVINSLRKGKEDVKETKEGHECGMQVESSEKIEVGDVLEVFAIEERERSL
jgi:translation initiation factor IF-2